jgi:hypothetical protein
MVSGMDIDVKLCVIDIRLGKEEDNAEEQVLGSWSTGQDPRPSALMDVARLARGSMGLCSHFSKVCDQHCLIKRTPIVSICQL